MTILPRDEMTDAEAEAWHPPEASGPHMQVYWSPPNRLPQWRLLQIMFPCPKGVAKEMAGRMETEGREYAKEKISHMKPSRYGWGDEEDYQALLWARQQLIAAGYASR